MKKTLMNVSLFPVSMKVLVSILMAPIFARVWKDLQEVCVTETSTNVFILPVKMEAIVPILWALSIAHVWEDIVEAYVK